jgi:hypothetical protein
MRIDILCKPESESRGDRVLYNVRQALDELGVKAEVHLYRDRRKMIDHRVYVAPALLVDDNVRIAGRVPAVSEIKSFIVERPRYVHRLPKVA